ncbi:hypothetical protein K4F52_001798 [Lecanicillium sp. MT-2017a]|nr:hypothetical protein K4F52_001798 [Lecanicillium sp. MT-2017a]
MEVHIVAIFTPKPDKVDRLKQVLRAQCTAVHEKEDYALRFVVTEQINCDTPDFALFETYKSEEATNQHVKEPHFQDMVKTLEDEGLLAKAPYVVKTSTIGGFDLDKKLAQ